MAIERLVENIILSKKDILRIPLTESNNKIICEDKEYSASEAYRFKVWRLDEVNKNNRRYSKKLAEYAIKNFPGFCYGYMDHPKDEGSVKDIWAVEKNPQVLNDENGKPCLYADFYLVGEHGKLVKDILNVPGAGVGLSSSSYGEVDKNGNVLIEGFEIERLSDFVSNPSYSVWGFSEDAITESVLKEAVDFDKLNVEDEVNYEGSKWKIKEIKSENEIELRDANNTNIFKVVNMSDLVKENKFNEEIKCDTNKEEKKEGSMNKPYTKVEEKTFRFSINNLLKEAEEIKDPQEKKDALEDIKEWFEDTDMAPDLKKDVDAKIESVDKEIKELAKKGLRTDSLVESEKSLKESLDSANKDFKQIMEKYEVAADLLDSLKVYSKKMTDLYENQKARANGMVDASTYNEALTFIDLAKKSLKEKENKIKVLENSEKTLKESLTKTQTALNEKLKIDSFRIKQIEATAQYKKIKEDEAKEKEDTDKVEADKAKEAEDKEKNLNVTEAEEVKDFYDKLEKQDEGYKKFKSEILSKKTLLEAQIYAMKLDEAVNLKSNAIYERKNPLNEKVVSKTEGYKIVREKSIPVDMDKTKRKGWF